MNNCSGFLGFGFAIIILTEFVSSETTKNMYKSCKPLSCGNNGPNITYPFYIVGQQDESCGFPPFNGVQCEGGNPIYTTRGLLGGGLGNSYIIRNISDYGTSARLVTNATLDENCPIPLHNMSYPSDLFTVSTTDDDGKTMIAFLCFFHGCNSATPLNATEIHCNTNSRSYVVGLGSDRSCNKLKLSGNYSCSSVMEFPVEVDRNETQKLDQFTKGIDYVKLLNGGFSLKMNWSRDGCFTCEKSGGRCGYNATATRSVCHCKDRTHLTACRDDNNNSSSPAAAIHPKTSGNDKKLMQIGLGVGIGGLAVIILVFSIYMIRCRRRSKSNFSKSTYTDDSFGGSNIYFEVPIFTNGELERATNNFKFSNELGDGGYGIVYYGKLRDGREVAVKRLYEHNYRRVKQFMTEVQILTRLRHTNLVSLYGCTSRRSQELLLVYEYVPNGTVADHLHGNRAKPGSLPWPVRMNIALETAKALAYLHKEGIIHRDVKTNNILLDKNFSVKVGDFGLSRLRPIDVTHVSTAPQGTPGYVDPEYHLCYQLTEKSDVYSFGVVLVELVSSMPAVDISRDRHEINLANLAVNRIQKRAVDELIDPNLKCESDDKIKSMVTAVIELSFRCLQQDREIRPTMDEVVEELENAVQSGGGVEESCDSIGKRMRFLTSPESDETGLLNNVKFLTSPVSVIGQNWTSSSSNTSINSKTPFSTL